MTKLNLHQQPVSPQTHMAVEIDRERERVETTIIKKKQ